MHILLAHSTPAHLTPAMDFYCDQVLSGKLPVQRIMETEKVLAFHHTEPYWPVHIVIVPKQHVASLADLDPGEMTVVQEMLSLATELCRRVTKEFGGCRLSSNCGDYQTTKHLHFYIHYGRRLRDEQGMPIEQSLAANH